MRKTPARLAAVLLSATASAQVVPPRPAAESAAKGPAVTLNPFEVKAEADNSYGALNSNSLTQFNTALNRTPVSADIFTEDFMRDISATSIEEMLNGYGAGAGTVMSNPDSDALSQQPGDRVGNQTIGIRGTGGGAVHRDGFSATGPANNFGTTATGISSTFDVERADVVRGPQGLLYGAGGAGGTVNTVSKRAKFGRNEGRASWRVDQYGSKQGQFDYNIGGDRLALRLSLLDDAQRYRRVLIGYQTKGYYGQLALQLTRLRTVIRLQGQQTINERIINTNQENIAFTNTATDPRHNFGLAYMMRNNLAGEINPATGQPWPRGAIANGKLTWDNLNSWAGWTASEYVTNRIYTASAETVWTRWLSTQFNVLFNDYLSDRANGGIANLSAPLLNGNPLNEWANGATLADTEQPTRRWAVRGAAMLQHEFLRGKLQTQTLLGYDIEWADSGPTDYSYFLADQNFNVVYNPAIPSNLGRTPMPRIWWSVADGPQKRPLIQPGWVSPRVTFAGQNYVRMANNPRDPSWVRPNNPLGLAQLAGLPGVSGQNNDGHHWENRTAGFYASNYTSWFGDRLG
ncbi:MAG: TonB-dependent receptor plug domain-containing protein, partial [Opitutaceae bacterium]